MAKAPTTEPKTEPTRAQLLTMGQTAKPPVPAQPEPEITEEKTDGEDASEAE